jgi:hypothetical protein
MSTSPVLRPFKLSKQVSFALDTRFASSRPPLEFLRPSELSYHPGKHAAPIGSEWDDTSFVTDMRVNFKQLQVFSGTPAEVRVLYNTQTVPTRNEGIVELHPRFNKICKISGQPHLDEGGFDKFGEDLKHADWILLSIDDADGELLDVVLHKTEDEDDHEDQDDRDDESSSEEEESDDPDAWYEPLSSSEDDEESEPDDEPRTPMRPLERRIIAPLRLRHNRTQPDAVHDGTVAPLALQTPSSPDVDEEGDRPELSNTTAVTSNPPVRLPAGRSRKRSSDGDLNPGAAKRSRQGDN